MISNLKKTWLARFVSYKQYNMQLIKHAETNKIIEPLVSGDGEYLYLHTKETLKFVTNI